MLTATDDLDDVVARKGGGQLYGFCRGRHECGVLQCKVLVLVHRIDIDSEVHGVVEVERVARLADLWNLNGGSSVIHCWISVIQR